MTKNCCGILIYQLASFLNPLRPEIKCPTSGAFTRTPNRLNRRFFYVRRVPPKSYLGEKLNAPLVGHLASHGNCIFLPNINPILPVFVPMER